jgi:hypothetical protein
MTMAALAMVGTMMTGCASEDVANEAPQPKTSNNTVTLTTTISLDGGAGTRALDANGKKTFAKGDQVAILYMDTNNELKKAETTALETNDISSDGKKAKITVTLEDPKPDGQLRCIYPAAMAEPISDDNSDIGHTNFAYIDEQDGTLETIASKYDLAVYDGYFTSDAELPLEVTLKNQLAIVELTINDNAGNDITSSITYLEIKDEKGDYYYIVNRTAAADPIYVAMWPCDGSTITVFVNDVTIYKIVEDVTLAASSIYPITLNLLPASQ